jgi:GTP-binding protein
MIFALEKLRNIAIIAHVDHGKTTLVDGLLKQSGMFGAHETMNERAMDSGDLERERGITITAKNTAIHYKDFKINIVDTPGHADFGGEVERILSMVDGCCLLVDAAEGPLPQTRFVLRKAMDQGLKVIVVINKIDRPDARPQEVLNEVFNLFIDLEATDEQCDFSVVYTIGRDGKAYNTLEDHIKDEAGKANLQPLYEKILEVVPPPKANLEAKAQLLVANLSYSEYLGRLIIGRLAAGKIKIGQPVALCTVDAAGKPKAKQIKINGLFSYQGLRQTQTEEVAAGDVCVIAIGQEDVQIGDTLVALPDATVASADKWDPLTLALPRITVEEPTLQIEWRVNDSPFAGREGDHVTSRKLRERLMKETMTNVALKFQETDIPDRFILKGRGEFQMAILAEQMRREGYEFALAQPQILMKTENGVKMEPMELAVLDIPEFAQGSITQMFQIRKGILQNIINRGSGRVRLEVLIPSRGLIGLRSRFLTETRGEGLFNFFSQGYSEHRGEIGARLTGSLVADRLGDSNSYSLVSLQERGILFVGHNVPVYEGMVIGENAKEADLWVNPVKAKQLTNFRTVNKDDAIVLTPPKSVTLENGIESIQNDELLEVTPKSIRIRKIILAKNQQPKNKAQSE